jgi:hypothetical protein
VVSSELALAALGAPDPAVLKVHELRQVVRVLGALDPTELPLDPGDVVQVREVQLMGAHLIRMEGVIHYPPAAPGCLLMVRQDGVVMELVGEKTDQIRALDWADGAYIVLEGEDLGVSADSCSGGHRVLVRTFTLARGA